MENRKVYLDNHTNLLQLEEHMYPLVDVKTPNVFRNLFHYDEIPKIAFNDRIVPHSFRISSDTSPKLIYRSPPS